VGADVTRPGAFAWFGASLVWTGAATLSFSGLDGLAVSCYISPALAPLLPLVIDVGVAVAAWVWRRGVNPEAARLAGRLTWSLLVLTITGNGAHLGMEASHVTPPWWVAALVGAIPPAVAGATAHLLVLLGRVNPDKAANSVHEVATSAPEAREELTVSAPSRPKRAKTLPAPTDRTVSETKAAALLASGAGRRKLARALDISEHQARVLLEQHAAEKAPNNGVKVLEDA
jgi:hypothetical protein